MDRKKAEDNARYVRDKIVEKFGPAEHRKIVREAMDKVVGRMERIELEAQFMLLVTHPNNGTWDW